MIDTHVHLYVEEYLEDLDQVVLDAQKAGVKAFFLPAIDASYWDRMQEVEKKHPNVYLMQGLHPCYVKKETMEEELGHVYSCLESRSFSALGEIGIDLYWDKSSLEIQTQAFLTQINWARQFGLPIVIHARESNNEILDLLEAQEKLPLGGIFHCFSGDLSHAQRAINLGFYLGIGGVVTFKNAGLDKVLSQLPLDRLVLETDGPYLSPVPYRGKRNQPSYLVYIVEKLAEIYQTSTQNVIEVTTKNALEVLKTY